MGNLAGEKGLYTLLWLTSVVLMSAALYLIFMIVPDERTMGALQRILYFHAASAVAAYCSVIVVFLAGVFFLFKHSPRSDILVQAAGETGLVFCSMVLVSGMIWAHFAWNTWFNWEPRLVTFVVLWLIFLAINLVRAFADSARAAQHCAVLAILGGITVPFVVLSTMVLPRAAQLHPQVISGGGLQDSRFTIALAVTSCALLSVQFMLLMIRYRIGIVERAYCRWR